ncbi:MAG: peptidylprolyl isomerase [Bacteroidetes bacterium]|nr:peptidylprolyl isomerase [Bacteroidota bacterium]
MKSFAYLAICLLMMGCANSRSVVVVDIETSLGSIEVEVDTVAAPVTSANFLRYVDGAMYEGGSFFRVVTMDNQPQDSIRIEVIQGGANPVKRESFFEPIPLERTSTTGLKHLDGVISMARGTPDSANHSFFICIGDQPSLDFGGMRNPDGQGFAAFGRVTSGMDVVRQIQQGAVEAQQLTDPILILKVSRRGS